MEREKAVKIERCVYRTVQKVAHLCPKRVHVYRRTRVAEIKTRKRDGWRIET